MHELMEDLYELCETVEKDLQKTNEKLRMAGGDMSGSDLEYVDKLTHTLKSIKTTMAMLEAEEDGYSREDGNMGGSSRRSYRNSSYRGNTSRRGSYRDGGSYRGQRRDSMGRYSREGEDEFREMLSEAMESAPNDQLRSQIERVMQQM